jgi:hypothetical protein
LTPPRWRHKAIREVLGLVHDLAVPKLHDADCVRRSAEVADRVFGDPQLTTSNNSADLEARWLAGVMSPQSLQIPSSEDALPGLRVITNGIVIVNGVLRICVSGC